MRRTRRSPDDVPANDSKSGVTPRSAAICCRVCGADFAPWKMEIKTGGVTQPFSEFGDIMDDFTNPAELAQVSQNSPVLVIIEQHVLARTCILNILKRELTGFEIVEMATTSGLNWFSGRDIRLIALNIGDKQITDPSIEDSLALLAESCPKASVAVLSNRDDEATASAAMQRGVRGFFPISIPVEVAIAGLRLVLAGAVYRPLPIVRQNGAPSLNTISEYPDVPELSAIHEVTAPPRLCRRSDGRPYATRTTCARGAAARPSQQADCLRLNFRKHRKNAYSAHHAKMFRT